MDVFESFSIVFTLMKIQGFCLTLKVNKNLYKHLEVSLSVLYLIIINVLWLGSIYYIQMISSASITSYEEFKVKTFVQRFVMIFFLVFRIIFISSMHFVTIVTLILIRNKLPMLFNCIKDFDDQLKAPILIDQMNKKLFRVVNTWCVVFFMFFTGWLTYSWFSQKYSLPYYFLLILQLTMLINIQFYVMFMIFTIYAINKRFELLAKIVNCSENQENLIRQFKMLLNILKMFNKIFGISFLVHISFGLLTILTIITSIYEHSTTATPIASNIMNITFFVTTFVPIVFLMVSANEVCEMVSLIFTTQKELIIHELPLGKRISEVIHEII